MKFGVQSLMDAYFNVLCTNAIYKHIHHGEYTNMYIMLKWCQYIFVGKGEKKTFFKFFSQHVNLSQHVVIKCIP
jgi:hypothetical protein